MRGLPGRNGIGRDYQVILSGRDGDERTYIIYIFISTFVINFGALVGIIRKHENF